MRTSTTALAAVTLFALACGATSAIDGQSEDGTSESDLVATPTGIAAARLTAGLTNPTAMQFAPDGRLFVSEQGGTLRVIKNGALLPAPFVKLTVDSNNERGLLGIAFDPDFAHNGFVYVYYTSTTPRAHNRLSRFTASGDVAVAGSETVLLDLDDLSSATNHNGGNIQFGPDGELYVAVGENANGANAQTLSNLLGKMLRIHADGTIPASNPFFGSASGKNRAIWALGLRNPFTFAFQPGTHRMFINDVGLNTWEEIDEGIAGANYGWPTQEGNGSNPSFRNPIVQYGHGTSSTTGCAITGGAFYNPGTALLPAAHVGKYFFADACSGWIRELDPSTHAVTSFASGLAFPVSLQVGPDGALYVLTRSDSSVWRIGGSAASGAPAIGSDPRSITVTTGKSATFTVDASGTGLGFAWFKNGTAIAGATGKTLTLDHVQHADNGAHVVAVVANGAGTVTSATATLSVADLPANASLSHDVRPILGEHCGGCHLGGGVEGGFSGGLDLNVGHTHANLLAHSNCSHAVARVVPGSPSHSLLWQKLGGGGACGSTMPLGEPTLKTSNPHQFDVIEAWIAQGAKDN